MPERFASDDPREWLNRARSNLIQARERHPGVYLEDLCFQAQQAVEKAFKAVLLHHGIRFPYTHDLGELIRLIGQGPAEVPERIHETARLTQYAVQARYPGLAEPVSHEEYEQAVELAGTAVGWAQNIVSAGA